MSIEAGRSLLHYKLVEKLGEGGMGVVWKAQDTTLNREVAIKVLPPMVAQDAERLARFDREAKLLASLNHANIAAIYGLHEDGDVRFLAMEYVEGEDLSKRLVGGPLGFDEVLNIARQVADALESAHASGVVHRDLKPANIMIGSGGKAKVLDFGLAKALEAGPSNQANPSMSPTLTSAGTQAGVILGTAAYMSPEQARGESVDKRSDVWAFGCVLFEMLSGRILFKERTVTDTLASVLKVDPDWGRLPVEVPENLHRLLRRCLQKDSHQRLHDVADARIEIEETLALPREQRVSRVSAKTAQRRSRPWLAAILALGCLAVGAAIGWRLQPAEPAQPTRRFLISGTDPLLPPREPRISPDGRRIVYRQDDRLYLRDVDQFEAAAIVGTEGARRPFWSPDSSTIAYVADDKVWKVPANGGRATTICDIEGMQHGSWGDDGTLVLEKRRSVHRVSARGGDPRVIHEVERSKVTDLHGVHQLPGGRGTLVIVHDVNDTCALEIWEEKGAQRILAFEDGYIESPHYVEPGFVLYTRSRSNEGIWALPFSLADLKPEGEPFLVAPLAEGPSVADDGTLIYLASGAGSDTRMVWIGPDGTVEGAVGQPQSDMWIPTPSPDGTKVVVVAEENNEYDLWIHEVSRGSKTRLTFTERIEGGPSWSPDGSQIFFYHPVFGESPMIYTVPADGRGDPRPLVAGASPSFTADGKWMAFIREGDDDKAGDLWTAPADGSEEPEVFLATQADETAPRFSPDGRFLAYASNDSGRNEIYIKPFPSGEGKWQVSIDGGYWPIWSPEGDKLFFNWDDKLHEVRVTSDRGLRLSSPRVVVDGEVHQLLLGQAYGVASGGERILAVQKMERGEEEGQKDPPQQGIFVVQNWLAEFQD